MCETTTTVSRGNSTEIMLIPMFGVTTMVDVGTMYLVQFDLLRRLYSEISEILHASIFNTK